MTTDKKNTEVRRKKPPAAISAEIASLVSNLFPGKEDLFQEVREAIASTRKIGKVSPGVILSLLQSLQCYPQEKIWAGIRTYLDREYFRDGKGEKYLIGIIRNESRKPSPSQEFKSTGSPMLDAHYRNQAKQDGRPGGNREAVGDPGASGDGSRSPLFEKAMADYHAGKLRPHKAAQ